jgi:hypothetical protein
MKSYPITEKIHNEVLSYSNDPVMIDEEVGVVINCINQFCIEDYNKFI